MTMKRGTIRYYTNSGLYKGWEYIDKADYKGVMSWLNSGNYIMQGNQTYTCLTRMRIGKIIDDVQKYKAMGLL